MTDKTTNSREIYHEKAFDKITQEKRDRILNVAVKEFSSNGYNAASINTIARESGISIGGMYRYFKSKEALFMSVLDWGYSLLEEALSNILDGSGKLFDRIETMLYTSVEYARNYREMNQIYIDVSTEGLSSLSKKISLKMEGITAKIYHEVLAEGKKQGVLRADIHPGIVSFCVDNLVIMLQFAYASNYYMERLKIYIGKDVDSEDELISGIMDFIRHGISV